MGGKVIKEGIPLEGLKEVDVVLFGGQNIRAIEPTEVSKKILELGESLGMVEEGDIVFIDGRDHFPFL